MFIEEYNSNLYLQLVSYLGKGLDDVTLFVDIAVATKQIRELEGLIELYEELFNSKKTNEYIEFGVSMVHKVMPFREVEHNRANAYYHLKLYIKSEAVLWLDDVYGNTLSRLLKYYKALFSKIDSLYSNNNSRQQELCNKLIADAKSEIASFRETIEAKNEINSERLRLKKQYLEKIPFKALFHITHISNITGILQYGILSHTDAYLHEIVKTDISNPEINKKRSRIEGINNYKIHDYAPLYFHPKNPMLKSLCGKKKLRDELVLIKISPNILVGQSVLFTDGNAAEESSRLYNNLDDFNKLNWQCINDEYYLEYTDGKRIKCSEVLVYPGISLPYINELIVYQDSDCKNLFPLFPNHLGISVTINKDVFY